MAGYATNYEVNAEKNFTFITVRCNGVLVAVPGCLAFMSSLLYEMT